MGTISNADEEQAKKIILALSQVLSTNNNDKSMTGDESLDNIEKATIRVFCESKEMDSYQIGTGLLLTKDGIFVTAHHIIEPYLKRKDKHPLMTMLSPGIEIESNRNKHEVSEVFCWNKSLDLALCYANIPYKNCEAIKFKTYPGRLSYFTQPVTVISIKQNRLYRQVGKIMSKSKTVNLNDGSKIIDGYDTDAYSLPGFSGGPVVSMNGELLGLCLYTKTKLNEELGTGGFTPVENIEGLVHFAFQHLGEILRIR